MKRRIVAAAVAVLLAVVGGVLVLNYVAGADQRALAGMKTVNVLVVTAPIAEGTPADHLGKSVAVKTLPVMSVPGGVVTSLAEIAGLVANADLQPGEQLLVARFSDAKSLGTSGEVAIPKGLQQVSVLLESQRVLGGNLDAGATVGVFISLDGTTHLTLHKVLVSRVQGGLTSAPPTADAEGEKAPAPLPEGSVMVTLAVTAADAEKIVFAAENGTIWLSLENADAVESGTKIVKPESVYQ